MISATVAFSLMMTGVIIYKYLDISLYQSNWSITE